MRGHTPQGEPPGSARRPSSGQQAPHNPRASFGGFSRPHTTLRESRLGNMRASTNQPSYNLFTGETNAPATGIPQPTSVLRRPSVSGRHSILTGATHGGDMSPPPGRPRAASNFSRESSKENHAPPDAEEYETQRRRIEELKAEVGTLNYAMRNLEQERDMLVLEKDNEVREARRKADEDFKARQAVEAEKSRAQRQAETLASEMETLRAEGENARRDVEKRAREAEEEARLLREQLEDLAAAKDDAARRADREVKDVQAQLLSVQRTVQEMEQEANARNAALQKAQEQLAERDETVEWLEGEVLRLKAQTGDAETMAVIQRELADQVAHIRTLEATSREQLVELKHLRQTHRAVEIVEEEKRSLERKLNAAEAIELELQEERRQRQRLEDEHRAWASYLRSESSADNPIEFESPVDLARALVEERLNSASLMQKIGEIQPEVTDRENIIKALEQDIASLKEELEKAKTATVTSGADKGRIRIERQRALALKEVEYLRAQLKTFDSEDVTYQPDNFDQVKQNRIQELEDLVDKYKEEVQSLHNELSSLESASTSPTAPPLAGAKRQREPDVDNHEQLGQLARKNRKLQDELSELQSAHRLLQTEYKVSQEQLKSLQEKSKTRILSLRSNPTSDFEAVKTSTLAALKLENAELLSHIQRQPTLFATVPASQLAAAQREIADAKAETASSQKSARRLKEVWSAKSAEFKEAIFSTLGWTVTFIPNGKMRVESVYCPSLTDEHENSIVFDGEKGTMKVGGGPRSAFAQKIGDNIKFWVRERGCVPCFLAALTLEFYEEHTRAARPS
ncbi:spindle assembly checkpoint component Mad1 [Coniochaeta sp. 2T2.1]|nr:spindle assembly checkpoint component Mad1 [Coniochaeta sp. 2T2.1]